MISAIRDSNILTLSLVRHRSDCICIFFTSATSHDAVSEQRIPFSTCQRHGDTRRRKRISRWRRMTGTHAYSLIGRGSFAASLTSASIHSISKWEDGIRRMIPGNESTHIDLKDLWIQRSLNRIWIATIYCYRILLIKKKKKAQRVKLRFKDF